MKAGKRASKRRAILLSSLCAAVVLAIGTGWFVWSQTRWKRVTWSAEPVITGTDPAAARKAANEALAIDPGFVPAQQLR